MKKIIFVICFIILLTGCGKTNDEDLIKNIKNKISSSKSYQMTATLDIYRNEEKFTYDVISSYKKDNNYKVSLINKTNNHEQIILKNEDSVYVLTPSLNKSFKFQRDWPNNNSQIYLLEPILKDLENDKDRKIENKNGTYIITSKVNYTGEKDFQKQKVYFDKDKNLIKVEVLDSSSNVKMCLSVINLEFGKEFESDYFKAEKYNIQTDDAKKENEVSLNIDEIVYPMYVPVDTYLTNQDVVTTEKGERVILTFAGESNFTFVQEPTQVSNEIDYVYGDPYLILDTVGSITDYSVSWISNGVEYSLMSDDMQTDEMLLVAQSIGVTPVGK